MNKLLEYRDTGFINRIDFKVKKLLKFSDSDYIDFLSNSFDGFYFSKSLHIYGYSEYDFHNIEFINNLIQKEYDFIKDFDLISFACDVFGNQFCFAKNGIALFNIETGEKEILTPCFRDWIDIILTDPNYYSGESILTDWEELMTPLKYNERFLPLQPFVIGGQFAAKNMRVYDFITVIKYNASLARQIYNLPDGSSIEIEPL